MFNDVGKAIRTALVLLLLAFIPCIPVQAGASVSDAKLQSSNFELRDFDFVTGEAGWILLGNQLYRTKDSGETWMDITPPSTSSSIGDVTFVEDKGWAILTQPNARGGAAFALAISTNAGASWQTRELPLFESNEQWLLPEAVHLFFLDENTGWLVIQHATSANFSVGSLFRTTDGGGSWERLGIPIGEPVFFVTPELGWTRGGAADDALYRTQDGGISWEIQSPGDSSGGIPNIPSRDQMETSIVQLDMVTNETGWAKVTAGECTFTDGTSKSKGECTSEISLQKTTDGGQTWQVIPLPQAPSGIIQTHIIITAEPEQSRAPLVNTLNTETISGQGFDTCEIPNAGKLQLWWNDSPYKAVNLYIGGSARSCSNTNLSASFLAQLEQQGWKFIPTWVGPQAPCTAYSSRMSDDPAVAYSQGVSEADSALIVAAQLGLANADQTGTAVYYDLEAYDISNAACKNAVNSFISGWVAQMESRGNISAMYGASCSSALTEIASLPNPPDAIWIANWVYNAYNSSATVWDAICLSNSYWPNHQRLRQYAGGHDETWGSLTLNIDSNVLDGVTAARSDELANDDFDNAIPLPTAPYVDSRAIGSATTASDDPNLPCATGQGYQTVWYRFTPPASGKLLIHTRGSNYDTVLALWTGSSGNLTSQGCSDNLNGQQSEVQIDAVAGATYFIEAASNTQVGSGLLDIYVHMPASDEFNGAKIIPSVPYKDSFNTTSTGDSNDDPATPGCNLAPGSNSIWYKIIPTTSGRLSMDTLSSSYDTYIAIWSGPRGALSLVACNDDSGGQQSQLEAMLTAGNTYYIEIAQFTGEITPLNLIGSKPTPSMQALGGGILNFHVTSFFDVPGTYWAWDWIESLASSGITSGCGITPKIYCPDQTVTRAQMAVFLLKGAHGSSYLPPPAMGTVFGDVANTHWAAGWIEQLAAEGITSGCGAGYYCPESTVTRAQMAVFLLKTKHGSGYIPPVANGIFADVPASHWAASWIEQLAAEGITGGCGTGLYCPEDPVTRAQMAVFLVKTFNLPKP